MEQKKKKRLCLFAFVLPHSPPRISHTSRKRVHTPNLTDQRVCATSQKHDRRPTVLFFKEGNDVVLLCTSPAFTQKLTPKNLTYAPTNIINSLTLKIVRLAGQSLETDSVFKLSYFDHVTRPTDRPADVITHHRDSITSWESRLYSTERARSFRDGVFPWARETR